VVYKVRDSVTGDILALKRTRIRSESEGIPSSAIREVSLLQQFQHPNIVRLVDVLFRPGYLDLVFEYVPHDLTRILKSAAPKSGLDGFYIKSFLFQMLQGLAHIHAHGVIHRDLKPQNLLVDPSGILKLADFGLARSVALLPRTLSHEVVTLWYRPPELLCCNPHYTTAVDIWSAGCIFAQMVAGHPLFNANHELALLHQIFEVLGVPSGAAATALGPGFEPEYFRDLLAKQSATAFPDADDIKEEEQQPCGASDQAELTADFDDPVFGLMESKQPTDEDGMPVTAHTVTADQPGPNQEDKSDTESVDSLLGILDCEAAGMADPTKGAKPKYPRGLAECVPRLDRVGLHLLRAMLRIDPNERITAQSALAHPFFKDLKLRRIM